MKKNALRKDFYMEIRRSLGRFLSIFFIVAIGCAFFAGIRSSEPDMRYSGDQYFDRTNLMDLQVISTMGLTDEDLDAIGEIDGVSAVEGGYSMDVLCTEGDNQVVMHVMSLLPSMNQMQLEDGRLPKNEKECVVDARFLERSSLKIGDEIQVSSGTEDPITDTLKNDTFTIVGSVSSPCYISFQRGSTTIGDGSIKGFIGVEEEVFDLDVYTEIYAQVEGAKDLTVFTDAYDECVNEVMDRVEAIKEERENARYDGIVSEAQEKLDDAKQKVKDAEEELAQGKADADKKLSDARKKLEDAQKELDSGKNALQASMAQLASSRITLTAKQKELDQAAQELEKNSSTLNEKSGELDLLKEQRALLQEQRDTLTVQKAELEEKLAQMQETRKTLEENQAQLKTQYESYQMLKITYNELETQQKALQEQCSILEEQIRQMEQAGAEDGSAGDAADETEGTSGEKEKEKAESGQTAAEANSEKTEMTVTQDQNQITDRVDESADASQNQDSPDAQLQQMKAQLKEMQTSLAVIEAKMAEMQKMIDAAEQAGITEAPSKLEEIQAGLEALSAGEVQIREGMSQIDSGIAQIDDNLPVMDSYIQQGETALSEGKEQIAAARSQLADGQSQIDVGWQQIKEGEKQIAAAKEKIASGQEEISKGWADYYDGEKEAEDEISDGEKKIADAKKEIQDAEQEIQDLSHPKWYVYDRNNLPDYTGYGENADRMKAIGEVFPLLFFLVAALISLTTMTRMVEEERTLIGTLKALGYERHSIAAKYLGYAVLATLSGGVFGVLIGEKILPYIIITAYKIMYVYMPDIVIPYNLYYGVTACAAALACTLLATIFSCLKELREQSAELMRPPAPKQGKRVFLERIPFIWKRLNFTWKSTVRNLVRYKKRFFMTVFGISGCMGLMLFGFGLKDSIAAIVPLQYNEIQLYDGNVILSDDATDEEKENIYVSLSQNQMVTASAEDLLQKVTIRSDGTWKEVYLNIPENVDRFSQFVVLQDRITKEKYALDDDGAVLTEKMAKDLNVKAGDSITVRDEKKGDVTVKITHICENYMGHYLYMTPAVYEKLYGEAPEYNSVYYRTADRTTEEATTVGEDILKNDGALSVSYTTELKEQVDHMLESLDIVVVVLIISAGMLAFVVLYNLNNINITERKRELATLKVLGFYDQEVSAYVYRENVLLTVIGALFGMVIGKILHRFIIVTVEVDTVMLGRNIDPQSYLYAFLLTVAFSAFVNLVMYFKLKKIDMVESLKSVE